MAAGRRRTEPWKILLAGSAVTAALWRSSARIKSRSDRDGALRCRAADVGRSQDRLQIIANRHRLHAVDTDGGIRNTDDAPGGRRLRRSKALCQTNGKKDRQQPSRKP